MFDYDQPKTWVLTIAGVLLVVVVITMFFAWIGAQLKASIFSWLF